MLSFRFRFACAAIVIFSSRTFADSAVLPHIPPDRWAANLQIASTETGDVLLIQMIGLYGEIEAQIGDLGGSDQRRSINFRNESARELFLALRSFIHDFTMTKETFFSDSESQLIDWRFMVSVDVAIGRKRISAEMSFSDVDVSDKSLQNLISTIYRLLDAQGVKAELFLLKAGGDGH